MKRVAVAFLSAALAAEVAIGGYMLVSELGDSESDAAELPGPLLSEADQLSVEQPVTEQPAVEEADRQQAEMEDVSEAVVNLVNDFRVAQGQAPLYVDSQLSAAASAYCGVIAPLQWREHVGPDGDDPAERASVAGYQGLGIVENLAWGYASPEDVARAWQAGTDERNNLTNSLVNGIGVAHCFVEEGNYHDWWVFMAGIGEVD